MESVRCLIADIPQIVLADIVQRLAEENAGVEVVDQVNDMDDLPLIIKNKSINVLIVGMQNNAIPPVCEEALNSKPELLVVGLVNDGRRAVIYMDDVSKNEIIDIIGTMGKRN